LASATAKLARVDAELGAVELASLVQIFVWTGPGQMLMGLPTADLPCVEVAVGLDYLPGVRDGTDATDLRADSMAASRVVVIASVVSGPTCLCRMMPCGSTTNVSGTP
jgi:hypothetical protein